MLRVFARRADGDGGAGRLGGGRGGSWGCSGRCIRFSGEQVSVRALHRKERERENPFLDVVARQRAARQVNRTWGDGVLELLGHWFRKLFAPQARKTLRTFHAKFDPYSLRPGDSRRDSNLGLRLDAGLSAVTLIN